MGYIQGFAPWFAFSVISGVDWRWGAAAGFAIGLVLLCKSLREGVALDALVLDISALLLFATAGIVSLAAPDTPLRHYEAAASFTWLAVTAWGTLAVRRPFTLGIAKRSAPRELWNTELFLHINKVITLAWAVSFTATAAVVAVCEAMRANALLPIAFQIVGFLVPATFTHRYPRRMQARVTGRVHAAR